MLQFSFIWQAKENTSLKCEGRLTQKTQKKEKIREAGGFSSLHVFWVNLPSCLVAQTVKCLPIMREAHVQSLGQEDRLEKEMTINPLQYSCLENPMDGGAW